MVVTLKILRHQINWVCFMYDLAICSDSHNKPQNLNFFLEKTKNVQHHCFGGDFATTRCLANVERSIELLNFFEYVVGGNHDLSVVYKDIRDKFFCDKAEKKRVKKEFDEARVYQRACDIAKYLEENLLEKQKRIIKSMPQRQNFGLNGINISMSHDIFAPQEIMEARTGSVAFSTRIIDPFRARINFEYLEEQGADVGLFGHTHAPTIAEYINGEITLFEYVQENSEFNFKDGARYLINPGSLSETTCYAKFDDGWKMLPRNKNKMSYCEVDTENKKVKFTVYQVA